MSYYEPDYDLGDYFGHDAFPHEGHFFLGEDCQNMNDFMACVSCEIPEPKGKPKINSRSKKPTFQSDNPS